MKMLTFALLLLMAGGVAAPALATEPLTGPVRDALARALKTAWLPLESGLALSATAGTPISAKYEIDDGAFQLSVYTLKADAFAGDAFWEVIVDHDTGQVARAEVITDGGDLAAARDQRAVMARAVKTLAAAIAQAVSANPGYRAVSVYPDLAGEHPVAEITLLGAGGWKVVSERLD
jgi:hypothetical protein